MSWRGQPRDTPEDGYEWISTFLKNYDGDLLEFELDVDSEHFYDNVDVLLGVQSPHDHRRTPLQLTPSVLSVISDLQASSTKAEVQEVAQVPSISFCDLLKEAQTAAKRGLQVQASRNAATTPRKAQDRRALKHQSLLATLQQRHKTLRDPAGLVRAPQESIVASLSSKALPPPHTTTLDIRRRQRVSAQLHVDYTDVPTFREIHERGQYLQHPIGSSTIINCEHPAANC
ncbi:hypothetical protein AM587_10000785 [Phytophthora nicotianae]|uniref:Uncharacterized protein n=1 Tax=Phytophthora nicotianae TaxID=4792 RepID=A0A0W8CCR2_PHYNI|nr:hypothetical protein AM587_10000785 [Phytophthora nicotianae]